MRTIRTWIELFWNHTDIHLSWPRDLDLLITDSESVLRKNFHECENSADQLNMSHYCMIAHT